MVATAERKLRVTNDVVDRLTTGDDGDGALERLKEVCGERGYIVHINTQPYKRRVLIFKDLRIILVSSNTTAEDIVNFMSGFSHIVPTKVLNGIDFA